MEPQDRMTENWLTRKPLFNGFWAVAFLCLLMLGLTLGDWLSLTEVGASLKASGQTVFADHQYYRLWTSIFVHGDFSHLFSNLIIFIPLMYLVMSYFGGGAVWLAVLAGGLINAFAIQSMDPKIYLVGISGVVNWLGAFWLTLFYLIDRRENRRRRFAIVLFVTFVLFVPDTYKPEVSYLSHLIGYILGLVAGLIYYFALRKSFAEVEVFEKRDDDLVSEPAISASESALNENTTFRLSCEKC